MAAARALRSAPQAAADLALRALELTSPADPAALPRAVAAAETLAAAGRLDQVARIAHDVLARPLPQLPEDRLRCALSSVLCAAGQVREAADQAQLVLARPQLPDDLRDRALTAHLQALTGLRDELAGPVAGTVLTAQGEQAATPWRRPGSQARPRASTLPPARRSARSFPTSTRGQNRSWRRRRLPRRAMVLPPPSAA
ncbi:MAG: hypothetical protein ACRDOL_38715, partial [Streptosporangiaceae bacterium]